MEKKCSSTHSLIHVLRVTSSFALLGAVVAGSVFGWPSLGIQLDVRPFGAVIGGLYGLVSELRG